MTIEDGALELRRPASPARAGWVEAAKSIADAGDDELVMGEFGNEGMRSWSGETSPLAAKSGRRARASWCPCRKMHDHLRTVLVAPMTTAGREAPFRIGVNHGGRKGLILLDQVRAVDKTRLSKKLGLVAAKTLSAIEDAARSIRGIRILSRRLAPRDGFPSNCSVANAGLGGTLIVPSIALEVTVLERLDSAIMGVGAWI